MSRRWAARSLLVVGFAAVIVTAGLGPTEKKAQTLSTPSQPAAGYCGGSGTKQVCAPYYNGIVSEVPASTNSQTYCISAVSNDRWAHGVGPDGQLANDPDATTDPCEGITG